MGLDDAAKIEEPSEELRRVVRRLRAFCSCVSDILRCFLSEFPRVYDDDLDRCYLRLCIKIEDLLTRPEGQPVSHLVDQQYARPLQGLRDPDAELLVWAESEELEDWEVFETEVTDLFYWFGAKRYPYDDEDWELFVTVRSCLEQYELKRAEGRKALEQRRQVSTADAPEREAEQRAAVADMPQFDFAFIADVDIRDLLAQDWAEAQLAFANGLHKSAIILCGGILEALLVDALSRVENDAKFRYYQKWIENKDRGGKPPEIDSWALYRLIEIARDAGVISPDAAKRSHDVKDYRNLVHLPAQKRDRLRADADVANIIVRLLNIAYRDIVEWHEERGANPDPDR